VLLAEGPLAFLECDEPGPDPRLYMPDFDPLPATAVLLLSLVEPRDDLLVDSWLMSIILTCYQCSDSNYESLKRLLNHYTQVTVSISI
jgi:hypothetical protein